MVFKKSNDTKTATTTPDSTTPKDEANQPTKPDTPKQDETATWKTVESIGGAFTIKVPDGVGTVQLSREPAHW